MNPKLLIEQQGYAFVPSFYPELEPAAAAAALGVSDHVEGLRLVQELRPTAQHLTSPNTYSGNFGLGSFPFHTDLAHWATPPRYLMLRCASGDPTVETQMIDGRDLVEIVGAGALARCLALPRRPMKGSFHLLPIWQDSANHAGQLLRWDSIYLKPANGYALSTFQRLEEALSRTRIATNTLRNRGDTLLLDNWRVLHGRSSVQNANSSRKIYRVYLSALR
jgi:L-asparagine oxygenase